MTLLFFQSMKIEDINIMNIYKKIIGICLVFCILGCMSKSNLDHLPEDLNALVRKREFEKKIETFIVIFDTSISMSDVYIGQNKIKHAQSILMEINQFIPALSYKFSLRVVGFDDPSTPTRILYEVSPYTRSNFEQAVLFVTEGGGDSPLDFAINATAEDILKLNGNVGVLILSDWLNIPPSTVTAVRYLRELFPNRLCVHSILIGNDAHGNRMMHNVMDTSNPECSQAVTMDELRDPIKMTAFVKAMFLQKPTDNDGDGVLNEKDKCPDTPWGATVDENGCLIDSDKDGVYDIYDTCLGTKEGIKVDKHGCPPDSDGDGVFDDRDECPDTPPEMEITETGCPVDTDKDGVPDYKDKCAHTPKNAPIDEQGCWKIDNILFDSSKATIKSQSFGALDQIVDILKQDQTICIEIHGHTDSSGLAKLNQTLSEKRADAVKKYIFQKGVEYKRIESMGFGDTKPIAPNDTKEGKFKNRRIEIHPKLCPQDEIDGESIL